MGLIRKDRTSDASPTTTRSKPFIPSKDSPKDPFFKPAIQTKLSIGKSNDKYEQEADRVADKVVNQSKGEAIQKKEGDEEIQQKPIASEVTPLVQKSPTSEEEPVQKSAVEEEKVQKQEEEEAAVQMQEEEESIQAKTEGDEEPIQKQEEEEAVQTKGEEESVQMQEEEEAVQTKSEANSAGGRSPSIESRLNSSKGGGQKLSGKTKNEMESGFGSDFSNVNIHTDENAVQLSKDLGAKAFAHGNDVYFNKGQYNPESSEGKHLLAHELTHTIQQKGMVHKKQESNEATTQSVPDFTVDVGFNAFIPNTLKAPVYEDNKAWKSEPDPLSSKLFASDNRAYSQSGTSRIWQNGTFSFKGEQLTKRVSKKGVGASEQADPVYKITGYTPIHYGSGTGGNPIKRIVGIKNKRSKTAADKGSIAKTSFVGIKGFNFVGEASYPFSSFAPDIDFDVTAIVKVYKKGDKYVALVMMLGEHNEFPAYQAYAEINGTKHYFYTYKVDKNDGPGLINLNSSDSFNATKVINLN